MIGLTWVTDEGNEVARSLKVVVRLLVKSKLIRLANDLGLTKPDGVKFIYSVETPRGRNSMGSM
jgi:hypothetical protein